MSLDILFICSFNATSPSLFIFSIKDQRMDSLVWPAMRSLSLYHLSYCIPEASRDNPWMSVWLHSNKGLFTKTDSGTDFVGTLQLDNYPKEQA